MIEGIPSKKKNDRKGTMCKLIYPLTPKKMNNILYNISIIKLIIQNKNQ